MGIWTERAVAMQPIMELGRLAAEVGIVAEDKPTDLPDRPGYKWEPMLNAQSKSIGWQEVEDPDAEGTADNPINWISGMKVYANYFYTKDGVRYVCVQNGTPVDITEDYFEQF